MLRTQNLNTLSDYAIKDTSEYLTIIKLKSVNCYLLKQDNKYALIDSGLSRNRVEVEKAIRESGCKEGDLKLILATHGDSDHVGNCLYIRNVYGSKIAMHHDDLGMVERGDFTWNRDMNLFMKIVGKIMVSLLGLKLKKEDRFTPDIFLEAGQSLNEYGFNITVYSLPGHSKGSVGFLTAEGDFFCGDLLINKEMPARSDMISDEEVFKKSVEKLKKLHINIVYPGHGRPFLINEFFDNYKGDGNNID